VGFATLGLAARALEWKASTLTVATKPFQTTQDVVFEFKNAGAKPVTLVDIQTNCDCLDATSDQNVYAPGATGTIKARFTIGDRSGLYERLVTVVTDEEPNTARLVVRIEVPEIATVTPRSLEWKVNGAPVEKFVEVTPTTGLDIAFADASATNQAFIVRLEVPPRGKGWRVYLTPRSTAQPASAAIRIFGKDKSGHDVVVSAYGTIQ
jgi:hypothetical protein